MSCISFGCFALLFIALEVIGFELLEHTSKTGFLAHRDLLFLLADCQWELFRTGFLGWVPGMILEGVTLHDFVIFCRKKRNRKNRKTGKNHTCWDPWPRCRGDSEPHLMMASPLAESTFQAKLPWHFGDHH